MLLQDNADWQLQLATIQRYNEAGWLVLTEGIDFTKPDMLNVHLLAYGGSAYPVDIRDLAVAAQSLRRSYFRTLVCHTTPIPPAPPFPAPQDWDPCNMIVWLRQLARARGEEDMLVSGYHTACQLVACEWIGRFGREPQQVLRWARFPNHFVPLILPQNLPYAWENASMELPPGPDVDHWVFDTPMGPEWQWALLCWATYSAVPHRNSWHRLKTGYYSMGT